MFPLYAAPVGTVDAKLEMHMTEQELTHCAVSQWPAALRQTWYLGFSLVLSR